MKKDCSKKSKITSCRLAVSLAALLATHCLAAAIPGPTLTNRAYQYKTKGGEIIGFYPALQDPSDRVAEAMFNTRVHEFLSERRRELTAARKDNPLTLRINYESAMTRSGIISIRFEILAEERLMAHPNHLYIPLIIDTPQHREMQLKDLFRPGSDWLETLVRLTRADLSQRDLPTTEDWIEKGTSPNPGNFSVFRLTDSALEIFFPEYQVAPYGAGLQRVSIPLAELHSFLKPGLAGF